MKEIQESSPKLRPALRLIILQRIVSRIARSWPVGTGERFAGKSNYVEGPNRERLQKLLQKVRRDASLAAMNMFDFLGNLLDTTDFPARWHCGQWTTGHGLLHIVSDLGVWSAYITIPCVLIYFMQQRKDLPFRTVFWLFVAFILACGSTHLMEAVIFWWPAYRLAGVIKLFTAIVSWTTVFALAPIIPQALALRSPEALQREVDERRRVEAELRAAQRDLEARVSARTEELASANQALRMEVIQRQHAQEQAEFANRMKDEFLATLSHELRTPLTAIVGWAALLKTDQLGPEETGRAIETIARNARLQTRLIEDLLDVSRIVSGKLRIESQAVDVKKVIEAAIASTAPLADSKSIKIERSYADDAAFVLGDAARLQQVAWNLLSNAVKFTPVGGAISVQTSRAGNNAVIRIADNGEGIAPDLLPFVFDRFRQADSSTTRRHGGLGLGLAIVRHLVELHGGQVSIESAGTGHGATVTVILPNLAAAASPAARLLEEMFAEVPDNAAGDLTGRSALVVDDDPDTLGVLERILKGRGAKVVTASSANQAIETLGAQQPDVLVSDIGMPDGDGYHLIRQVRALENVNRHIPAVALTAFARAQDQACVIQAGFQAYLRKPIDPAELTSAIATLLNAEAGPTPGR